MHQHAPSRVDLGTNPAAGPQNHGERCSVSANSSSPTSPTLKNSIPPPAHILGSEAFRDCVHLETLAIPEGIQEIGDACFAGCEALRSITLPRSLRQIGFRIFEGCGALQRIEIAKGNRAFTTHGPFLLSRNGKTLRACPTGLADRLRIPEGIEEIGDWAFHGCINLESITLPQRLRYIGDGAFSYCTSLCELEIPPGVRSIGLYAFRACTQLRRIRLPSGLHELGDYAFERCSSLRQVEFFGKGNARHPINHAPKTKC